MLSISIYCTFFNQYDENNISNEERYSANIINHEYVFQQKRLFLFLTFKASNTRELYCAEKDIILL